MKSVILKFKNYFILAVLGFSLSNCSSDDEGGTTGEFINASVDNFSFQSRNDIAEGATASKIDGGEFITFLVQGFDDAGNILVIVVPDYDGPGTYNLGSDTVNSSGSGSFANQQLEVWNSSIEGGTGSITILTDTDTDTTGNFEFVGISEEDDSTRTITNGEFSVDFEN